MEENELIEGGTAAAQIIEAARARKGAKLIDLTQFIDDAEPVPMLALPQAGGGVDTSSVLAEVKAWKEFRRERPDRREGTAQLGDFDSFCAHTNRFKDADSAIWISGDPNKPKFTSVLDYHEAVNEPEADLGPLLPAKPGDLPVTVEKTAPRTALPRFGKHRGVHVPEFSEEWRLWSGVHERPILQADFAKLIENGARDIVDVADMPTDDHGAPRLLALAAWFHQRFGGRVEASDFYASQAKMLEMAEGLIANIEEKVGDLTSFSGGSKAVIFESATRSEVKIPTAFLLELPVFRGGDLVQLPARLRMSARAVGDTKRLEWKVSLYGADRAIRKEIADMSESVKVRTGLPVFVGEPETA